MSGAGRARRPRAPRPSAADRSRALTRHAAAAADPRAATLAAAILAVTLVGTALVVDVRAEAAFDAPKRALALFGLAGAAGCVLAAHVIRGAGAALAPRRLARAQRVILAALAVAAVATVVSALGAPRALVARDACRALVVWIAALPLGASAALAGGRGRWLAAAFVAGALVNALASLAQAAGVEIFATALIAGRTDTGGFLGNEASVAQAAAFALVVLGVAAWRPSSAATRTGLLATGLPLLAALVVDRSLTAFATVAAGLALAVALSHGRRALVPLGVAVAVAVGGVLAYPPMRTRLVDAVQALRSGDWDALTTYRLGPWSAAAEMVRERPLLGFGPGTFGTEFTAHRLRAEVRQRRRLVIPQLTSSFGEAHSDYLQAAAELGLPAAGALIVAAATLVGALARRVVTAAPTVDVTEAAVVVAVLAAAALSALTWFPFQRPVVTVPLLLAAGRGWRLLDVAPAVAEPSPDPRRSRFRVRVALALGAVAVLIAALGPELGRYAAERRLAVVTATLEGMAAGGRLVPEARPLLTELATTARATAAADPSDSRGLVAAGTAMLLANAPAEALGHYRAALGRGERAEVDLNLARAYALAGRREEAEESLLRAAWLSPMLVMTLPSADRARVEGALADREARFRSGELTAPPPLPLDPSSPPPSAPPAA